MYSKHPIFLLLSLLALALITSCGNSTESQPKAKAPSKHKPANQKALFTALPSSHTGIEFNNKIIETPDVHYLIWEAVYQGAGVAVGDINNDGLPDVCLIANMARDFLYLNKGNMQFENITKQSGINTKIGWSGGVTMADVNGDGWLDIYISRYGWFENPEQRENLLFINNGDLTFSEKGKEYGIANTGYTIQTTFFDYDKDGDLDLFVANQPSQVRWTKKAQEKNPPPPNEHTSDRLYRNNGNNTFTDVSKQAGIETLTFSLGVIASDLNDDGWTDIYVANDYAKPDFLFLNNKNGTFSDALQTSVKHISNFAMGCDVGDINNDGLPDIAVADMAAEDHYRSKTNMGSMRPERFWKFVNKGYHYQYMVNTLQLNNGNNTFSEIGHLAGIAKTDWSWATLFADFDNDSYKDLLITNGIKKDVRNNDYLKLMEREAKKAGGKMTGLEMLQLSLKAPSQKVKNYLYHNNGDLTFKNVASKWGLNQNSFSFGAAYADFDQDGDLDLIINNVDDKTFVYRNESEGTNYLQLKLIGTGKNTQALNAKATIHIRGEKQYQELTLTRGYMSACENILHFGLGNASKIDRLEVEWHDGSITEMANVKANQTLQLNQKEATKKSPSPSSRGKLSHPSNSALFADITAQSGIFFQHRENEHDDFIKEILLPHKQSTNGPSLAVGDVNGDGFDDFYIGGAKGQAGALYLQSAQSKFAKAWQSETQFEDIDALFFDADGDKDLDLYVVSGGNEFAENAPELQDRLYLNDGSGKFEQTSNWLPPMLSSGGCVTASDFDKDGDLDLFIGGRIVPEKYPFPPRSYLLQNDDNSFKDVTSTQALDMEQMGLVTDALWIDYDQDGDEDLIAVGEWMPVSIFQNNEGKFSNVSADLGLEKTRGLWFSLAAVDIDNDGDTDFALGNLGLNAKYKVNDKKSFEVYCNDFDKSGNLDIVLVNNNKQTGLQLPVRGRECSSEQMPFIQEKFPTYEEFATASLQDIYGEALSEALHYEADELRSSVLINEGGQFRLEALPNMAQLAPNMSILSQDLNNDGKLDLILAGNLYGTEVETVRYDAGIGTVLLGTDGGDFIAMPTTQSGFFAAKEVRELAWLQLANGNKAVLVANNNDGLQLFEWKVDKRTVLN